MTEYDSTNDTIEHVGRVRELIADCVMNLYSRGNVHDASKLREPEKSIFDRVTPRLKDSTYGSDEYKGFLADMKPALDHHYAHNSHHPEHYGDIGKMSALDIIEMLCDWKAAGERHANGSMVRSLEVNRYRFNIGPQLFTILVATALELGWIAPEEKEKLISPEAASA